MYIQVLLPAEMAILLTLAHRNHSAIRLLLIRVSIFALELRCPLVVLEFPMRDAVAVLI